ncbi:hypothetical protein KIL84_009336 [Mauremys mutica]|uniref:Uncharacterized protein n=1 Tax=Mauremys mutica TaxID=74926 RepID=A0A9D3XK39_9SAUR|nr:hypothetical protein KIL84_009336 [Mauremys mutica]
MRGCGAGAGPAVPPPLLLGLLLAAAPGAALAKETAFVEVVLFESSPSGDYTTYTTGLQGRFSRAGATLSAEGEIVQPYKDGQAVASREKRTWYRLETPSHMELQVLKCRNCKDTSEGPASPRERRDV